MLSVLTLNSGSSSLKFALFGLAGMRPHPLLRGKVDGLGGAAKFEVVDNMGCELVKHPAGTAGASIEGALDLVISWLFAHCSSLTPMAVGHRVVHGGSTYSRPVAVDDAAMGTLEGLVPLAPLHQPYNLQGIRAARQTFPGVPQIACFDTAFHNGHAFTEEAFALPRAYYEEGVRRYGFHGLSYDYVSRQMEQVAPALADARVIVAHLGSGASLCALHAGKSVASTMSFSALDGLVMGTRCGQIDPGVLLYLMDRKGMDAAALTRLLYHESGLKGLSGLSNDMRALEASDDPMAAQAIDCFVASIRREIGAMAATLGGLDGLVFTGGIGENSPRVRAAVTEGLAWLGIEIDNEHNANGAAEISTPGSRVRVLRVPTDEEAMIARHTVGLMAAAAADLVPLEKVTWAA
jgi:acetate kinase